jgi:hypothetical protein
MIRMIARLKRNATKNAGSVLGGTEVDFFSDAFVFRAKVEKPWKPLRSPYGFGHNPRGAANSLWQGGAAEKQVIT